MQKLDKKKRHTSGSRSKSKKSKPNDASIDMKPNRIYQAHFEQQHTSKNKTENSTNKEKDKDKDKSKGKKSNTNGLQINTNKNVNQKKNKLLKGLGTKGYTDQSKQLSRSVSAERKHSLVKMNRTEINFQNQDIERRIYSLKKNLNKIQKPSSINTKDIYTFFRQIQDSIQMVAEPLYSLLSNLHQLYMAPISQILDMISPYEYLLQKKQQLSRAVEDQVKYNQQIYDHLTEQQIQIIKLKQTIEEQRQLIEQKKKKEIKKKNQNLIKQIDISKSKDIKDKKQLGISTIPTYKDDNKYQKKQQDKNKSDGLLKNSEIVRNMKKQKDKYQIIVDNNYDFFDQSKQKDKPTSKQPTNSITEQQPNPQPPPSNAPIKPQQNSKTITLAPNIKGGLKLDLGSMNKSQTIGFHDEFYSKIDQFSQSWRNQALKEKRF